MYGHITMTTIVIEIYITTIPTLAIETDRITTTYTMGLGLLRDGRLWGSFGPCINAARLALTAALVLFAMFIIHIQQYGRFSDRYVYTGSITRNIHSTGPREIEIKQLELQENIYKQYPIHSRTIQK